MRSLRAKLTSSYILVALVSILLISVLANLFLEKQFRQYIKENLDTQNKQVVALINQQYSGGGHWNIGNITEIGMNALTQGQIIKLKNADGSMVWDATKHNNGLCQEMILHLAKNMTSRYPNWKGGYVETKYPVIRNFQKVGEVEVGYYGPFYFKDTDLAFINTLNRILIGVTVLALLLAFFIGNFMAVRLNAPIAKVINTAQAIAAGNLDALSMEKTNIKEINQLTIAINELARSLQQQENLRKRLTADVAHELRTPLATLQSHIEAMIDGIWQFDQKRLQGCHEEIMRVNRMVKDLERLAKFESESISLNITRFNLGDLIRQIGLNFEAEFENKEIKINLPENDLFIEADQDKISQVIINLLANSLKFTTSGGSVGLKIKSDNDVTEISVKDTGIGIIPEDLPNIFERFYRADKSRNRITGGTGIGLTITKAIVEAHQGIIQVQSEFGKGSEFIVTLPNNYTGHKMV